MREFDQFLAYMNKYIDLDDQIIQFTHQNLSIKKFPKGHLLLEEGQVMEYGYFINSGLVRDYQVKDGQDLTMSIYAENRSVASFHSFVKQKPSFYYIECMEACELVSISYEVDQKVFQIPKMNVFERLRLRDEMEKYERFIAMLKIGSASERYQYFIDNYPELYNRIPQYILASYIGIRPESLSRIRKKLSSQFKA